MPSLSAASITSALNLQVPQIRNLTGAGLLAAAMMLACALQTDSLATVPVTAVAPAAVTVATVAAPVGLSEFQKESAMSTAQLIARWNPIIADASKRFGIPENWIRAVMRAESGGKTMLGEHQPVVSTAGAMGLMQVMPDTYTILRTAYGLGADPFNPQDNIIAGTAYLRWLKAKYGYPAMFAAYNAGPGRLEQYIQLGTQLPTETRLYVGSITRALEPEQKTGGGFAHLTQPDGTVIPIDAKSVTAIRAALPGEFAPGVQTVLTVGQRLQGVRESVQAATAAIRAAGLTL